MIGWNKSGRKLQGYINTHTHTHKLEEQQKVQSMPQDTNRYWEGRYLCGGAGT